MKKSEAYITVDSFGSDCPDSWEYAAAYLNRLIDELPEDENGEIDGEDVSAIWVAYCAGHYLHDMAEYADAEELAALIRDEPVWDMELLRLLCDMAGMLDEWTAADGDTFEQVAFAAAEKLGVELLK